MGKRYEEHTAFNVAGLATGSILALIVAMAISIAFDIQPADVDDYAAAASATEQVATAHD
jgi:hypothetical protein